MFQQRWEMGIAPSTLLAWLNIPSQVGCICGVNMYVESWKNIYIFHYALFSMNKVNVHDLESQWRCNELDYMFGVSQWLYSVFRHFHLQTLGSLGIARDVFPNLAFHLSFPVQFTLNAFPSMICVSSIVEHTRRYVDNEVGNPLLRTKFEARQSALCALKLF